MTSSELFKDYPVSPAAWDEMCTPSEIRKPYRGIFNFLSSISNEELSRKEELAKGLFMSQGVTFTVYSSGDDLIQLMLERLLNSDNIGVVLLQ